MKFRDLAFLALLLTSCGVASTSENPASESPTPTSDPTPAPTSSPAPADEVGPHGGLVSTLAFAITGDSRPAVADDTSAYPTAIVQTIWNDIEAESIPFALTTGDYVNASSSGTEAAPQMDLYLGARAAFHGTTFPTMGNHECKTHSDTGNCGDGNTDGHTANFDAFVSKMLGPLGITTPNYSIRVDAKDGTWTSKFVVIAGNSFNSADSAWLDAALAVPTTYTFVVRHQDVTATEAPGVSASAPIIAAHPLTLLLCAHQHLFAFDPAHRQVIAGNGGAPLDTGANYGYTVIRQQPDLTLIGESYDFQTHAVQGHFHVAPDGTALN